MWCDLSAREPVRHRRDIGLRHLDVVTELVGSIQTKDVVLWRHPVRHAGHLLGQQQVQVHLIQMCSGKVVNPTPRHDTQLWAFPRCSDYIFISVLMERMLFRFKGVMPTTWPYSTHSVYQTGFR